MSDCLRARSLANSPARLGPSCWWDRAKSIRIAIRAPIGLGIEIRIETETRIRVANDGLWPISWSREPSCSPPPTRPLARLLLVGGAPPHIEPAANSRPPRASAPLARLLSAGFAWPSRYRLHNANYGSECSGNKNDQIAIGDSMAINGYEER